MTKRKINLPGFKLAKDGKTIVRDVKHIDACAKQKQHKPRRVKVVPPSERAFRI
jgi:hypothetical protein